MVIYYLPCLFCLFDRDRIHFYINFSALYATMKSKLILLLLATVTPLLPLVHAVVPLAADLKDATTVYIFVSAPSSAPSILTLTPDAFITPTALAPISTPPIPSTVIYTATESWSLRIWPPWFRTALTAAPSSVPAPTSESREGI